MDKLWLYVGGIIVGAAMFTYFVITSVGTVPPSTDLRAVYEKVK